MSSKVKSEKGFRYETWVYDLLGKRVKFYSGRSANKCLETGRTLQEAAAMMGATCVVQLYRCPGYAHMGATSYGRYDFTNGKLMINFPHTKRMKLALEA